ncbi:MAG TPA: hypothetical protein VF268_05480 [Gammaproteobacteria bacterium]
MSRKSLCFALVLTASVFSGAASAYYNSSLGRFQAYATTWYNSYGNPIGIRVHYNIGALMDQPSMPSQYAAVCINTGSGYAPCIEQTAKVWTKTTSYYSIGTWVTQNIQMTCNSTVWRVQVHQPYLNYGSTLNFHVSGGSPYQGGQLFYSGSSDTANFQVSHCAVPQP